MQQPQTQQPPTQQPAPASAASNLQQRVTDLVVRVVQESSGRRVVPTADQPLLASGVLDSMAMVSLVVLLQQEFAIELQVPDLREENFASIAAITRLVAERI